MTRYNQDPSWDAKIAIFTEYILNDSPMQSSSSEEVLRFMQLASKIYYADAVWIKNYKIPKPNIYE